MFRKKVGSLSVVGVCLLLMSAALPNALAKDADLRWNWYSVLVSRSSNFGKEAISPLGIRLGVAEVSISGDDIAIDLVELEDRSGSIGFSGKISRAGAISGSLTGFEPDGQDPVAWVGQYREAKIPCSPQNSRATVLEKEIVLRQAYRLGDSDNVYPNGRILVLVKQQNQQACRAN